MHLVQFAPPRHPRRHDAHHSPARPTLVRDAALALALAFLLAAAATPVAAEDDTAPKRIHAHRLNPHAPRIDGRLDDAVWKERYFVNGFTQKEPNEGEPASVDTEVAIVYDDAALYVGARMQSADPADIRASVSRRDNTGNSERLIVSIDSYHDKRTAYTFAVTATGVREDYYHPGDAEGWYDKSYDPVWEAKTAATDEGWSAEMRIPFSQLRFNNQPTQVWGINFNRWIPTSNEDTFWVMIPKSETGWSSRFGELVGIEGFEPPRRLEIMPYYANDARVSSDADPDDPFDNGRNLATRVGGDVKMGLGPNLTLAATVNPDFGQVEADPAEVNLTAFETFFPERRPFFIEGSQLLAGNGPSYYYSRRIGAAPHGDAEGDFVERPDNTTIWTAAKLTGRFGSGLSLGAQTALTARESARTFDQTTGTEGRTEVEPISSYNVVRLQQEFGASQSTVGGTFTTVHRDVRDGEPLAEVLNRQAYAGGADWNLRFQEGKYELGGHGGFSYVAGDPVRIADVQQSSTHYFQRPDASHVTFDPTRRSLTGYSGSLSIAKNGGQHWLWEGGIWAESPGFEINDAGSLGNADDVDTWANLRYKNDEPGTLFRRTFVGLFVDNGWNFGGVRQFSTAALYAESTWHNFLSTWVEYDTWARALSDHLTRGGPLMGTARGHEFEGGVYNNWASNTRWNAHGFAYSDELGSGGWGASGGLSLKPADRLELSIDPQVRRTTDARQYVDTIEGGRAETFGERYVFSAIERTRIASQLRLNYSFTPDLSLEIYAEPFAESGRYRDFGELEAARSRDLRVYGTDGTTIEKGDDGTYTVTDGDQQFEFEQADFNVTSFRSNFVLRWEWSPGSTLFVVWQQDRGDYLETGTPVGASSLWDALTADGDQIFAVKVTYWLPVN